ncbi:MAG: hypothetical protein U0V87_13350 [Acidobacteriota bacterium]
MTGAGLGEGLGMYVYSSRRARRALMGFVALTAAVTLPVLGMTEASAHSVTQPLAPAIFGGGSVLLGLLLAKAGVRLLRPSRSRLIYRSDALDLGDRSQFLS